MKPVFFLSSGVFRAYRVPMKNNVDRSAYSTSRVTARAITMSENNRNDSN